MEIEDIGGETLTSKEHDKLLGLHISSDLNWKVHVEKLGCELKSRIAILKRLRCKVPLNKLLIIGEAIFNSKIRYGISVYLKPVFEVEDLKRGYMRPETKQLQVLQNDMLRAVYGI